MSTVYCINVGANSSHSRVARSPIFDDGRFVYVPFPTTTRLHTQSYTAAARPFVQRPDDYRTHADPDWAELTYGDYCVNPRAGALKKAMAGDILLFWGLLWKNRGTSWADFTGERDWCLLGALCISEVLRGCDSITTLSASAQKRARQNAHLNGSERLREGHCVFIGHRNRSALFTRAVSLGVASRDGLLYRAFTTAKGQPLSLGGTPAWKSSLRSCRPLWNLALPEDRARAEHVAQAIREQNDFDLLKRI